MLNIEQAITAKFPGFSKQADFIRKPALGFLKKIIYQDKVNAFLSRHQGLLGFEFIDAIFDYFNFSYRVSARDKANIPAEGRVVIVANHPIGSLDGLAILKLIGEVRSDVKIVANDMLMNFTALHSLFIPLDNLNGGGARRSIKAIMAALANEEAIVIFPAGEVSRAHPSGVKDGPWRAGFLHFARRCNAPILPVHIEAKNSLVFYGASLLFKPLGTALLAHEMFNKHSQTITFRLGEPIPVSALDTEQLPDRALVKRLKKHLYKIGKHKYPIFITEKTIAHPEPRQQLLEELQQSQLLGQTQDGNRIYLWDAQPNTAVMREIGRLREIAFRKVGEGTGAKRDIDKYDIHYRHLVLWDSEKLQIAGAYRLGEGKQILAQLGEEGFYTHSLYRYRPEFLPYLADAVELGRSFVNPDYWGKASLDYLWQGIGAYLQQYPARYLIGPVSMSARYPRHLMDAMVYFFNRYYSCSETMVEALNVYDINPVRLPDLDATFAELDAGQAFSRLQMLFQQAGHKLPVLFKQYLALFEPGGFLSLVFSIDPEFGDCLDGLCMADIRLLKANKRERYMGRMAGF